MGRFEGDGDSWEWGYAEQCLWEQAQYNALHSKRGRSALAELESALLAMPAHRLIDEQLVDADGTTCALGELAVYRRVRAGDDRATALAELWEEYPGDEILAESREDEATEQLGDELGLARTLVQAVAFHNDANRARTPEERWQYMFDWVRNQLAEKPLTGRRKVEA